MKNKIEITINEKKEIYNLENSEENLLVMGEEKIKGGVELWKCF